MADKQRQDQGTIHPTRLRVLLALFVVGGVLGWALVPVAIALNGIAPQVQWTSVAALIVIAAILLALASSTYRTVQRDRRRMDSQVAVRYLLLSKASSLVGSVVAGGYLGFGLQFIDQLNIDLPQQRVIRSLCAAVAGVLIVVAGLLLERACRVPKDKDDDKDRGRHGDS
ncbi:MAG: DUF3180 domain-containing protein [Nocardioidaceae bacterium]